MIKKFLVLSSLAVFVSSFAQQKHTVVKGDNPYNISKKYGMSLDELYRLNPKVKEGVLNIGDVLSVKGKATASTTASAASTTKVSGKTGTIMLQPKQTLYGITKQYHVTEADIRKLNPNLQMQIGEVITLPIENIQKYADAGASVNSAPTNVAPPTTIPNATAQTSSSTEVDEESYVVQDKDNYYRVTRKFGVTQSQLFAMNPGLEDRGLKPGDVIKVKSLDSTSAVANQEPVKTSTPITSTSNTSANDDFVTYTVQSGDTVFGILNRFGIGLDQLLELNPSITNGLKAGMVIKIKAIDAAYVKKSGDALNVVMMLPFGFDSNDSKYRAMSADFLTGAKLAIERNVQKGLKLDIKVVDAGNESSFKNSLSQINQDNTDLIIGPFFKSSVTEVLNFVGKKKIPVVAPFANSEDLYDYGNLIIMETADNVYADRIVKEVSQGYNNQKIYILSDTDKTMANAVKAGLSKSLKNAEVNVVTSASEIVLDKNMMTGQEAPIIAVLASNNDAVGNAFAKRVMDLSKDTNGLKAYSLYYHSTFEKNVDELSQANLVYLMDRKIDTDGSFEKEIIADYKEKYCKTPPKYAIIGFDIVNDILSRENKKGEVLKNMGKTQTQLATKFEYVRVKNNGAFVNTGYRVIKLLPQ